MSTGGRVNIMRITTNSVLLQSGTSQTCTGYKCYKATQQDRTNVLSFTVITLCVSETSDGLAEGVGPVRPICQIG